MKYFKTYSDLLYILRSGVGRFFAHLTSALFFRRYLAMFCVIVTGIWCDISWLENDLPSFEYFRRIALKTSLRKAKRGWDSSLLSLLIRFWRITSTIQANRGRCDFFIRIPVLYLATFWPILSTKLMFWS